MKHYLEQYRPKDDLITGRTDITDMSFNRRDQTQVTIARQSYPGYGLRRITSDKRLPCFAPVQKCAHTPNPINSLSHDLLQH